jgi:hypothetical protein
MKRLAGRIMAIDTINAAIVLGAIGALIVGAGRVAGVIA